MNKITCNICNKQFSVITNSHLKSHNITPEEYKIKYNVENLSSENSRNKMSERSINSNKNRKGVKRSKEVCDKIREGIIKSFENGRTIYNKNKDMSEEQKNILREKALERNKIWRENNNNPLNGHVVSEETKEKISNSLKKFNIDSYNEKDFSILHDEIKLNNELLTKTPKIISQEYWVSEASVYDYIKKYDINYHPSRSSYELEIENWLKEQDINFESNTKSIIPPLELDFFLPEYNLSIEFNGLYWHSDIFKEKNYHLNKYLSCKEKDIRLIMIQEDEWINKSNLIKSKILNIIGRSKKGLPARKLVIRKICNNIANDFCEKYHIQGKTGQIIYSCGSYDNEDNLVGVMIFNQQRNTQDIELIRFCTDGDIHIGLFSKMLKFSIKENNFKKIISFADLRYSEGNLYEKTGFSKLYQTKPDYMYINKLKRLNKSNFSKSSMKKKKLFESDEYVDSHTENYLTKKLGISKIYDIGKIKYELK